MAPFAAARMPQAFQVGDDAGFCQRASLISLTQNFFVTGF